MLLALNACLAMQMFLRADLKKVYISTSDKLKACVRCFLSTFYFSPNDSPSKTMKNVLFHVKNSFRSQDI